MHVYARVYVRVSVRACAGRGAGVRGYEFGALVFDLGLDLRDRLRLRDLIPNSRPELGELLVSLPGLCSTTALAETSNSRERLALQAPCHALHAERGMGRGCKKTPLSGTFVLLRHALESRSEILVVGLRLR